ncbi:alpha/beta fold hydrolase [Rhodococcus sp. SJ-3]|uniref:alpha/beta fold hydrolase n=1 Tax=Rhodococcus sp. SJ-3 TaxID=3454628 RepID=UPI003F7AC0BB
MDESVGHERDLAFYELSDELRDLLLIPFSVEILGRHGVEELAHAVVAALNSHSVLLSKFTVTHREVAYERGLPADRSEILLRTSGTAAEVMNELRSTMEPISRGGRAWRFAVLEDDEGFGTEILGLVHHMAADGTSLRIFLDTLRAELEGTARRNTSDGLAIYRRFVERAGTRRLDRVEAQQARSHWRGHLADLPENPFSGLTSARSGPSGPSGSAQPAEIAVPIPRGAPAAIGDICSRLGISEFALFHGVVLAALDTVGIPLDAPLVTATDLRDTLDTLHAVGNYSNLSVLRVGRRVDDFGNFLVRIAESDAQTMWFGYMPLSSVLAEAGGGEGRRSVLGPGIPSVALSYGRDFPGEVRLSTGSRLVPRPFDSARTRHLVSFDLKPGALVGRATGAVPDATADEFVIRYDPSRCTTDRVVHVRDRVRDVLQWLSSSSIDEICSQWPGLDRDDERRPVPQDAQGPVPDPGNGDRSSDVVVLEDALRECYARVLSCPTVVDADARFYDLGGYSLLALLVADTVASETGYRVTVEEILGHQTPAAIARNHCAADGDTAEVQARAVGDSGTGPAYLFFPPATGNSTCYHDLAAALGGCTSVLIDLPQTVGRPFDGWDVARSAVDAAHEHLIECGQTPIVCIGWSAGGMLAAYAADYLRSLAGDTGLGLVLVDSYPEIAADHVSALEASAAESVDVEAAFRNAYPVFGEYSQWYRRCPSPVGVSDLDVLHIQSDESRAAGYTIDTWSALSDRPIASVTVAAPHISMLSPDASPQIANCISAWLPEMRRAHT